MGVSLERAAAVAVGLVVVGALLAVTPSARAEIEPSASVVWPDLSDFNPSITDYVIDITWDGSGRLFLRGQEPGANYGFGEEITTAGPHVVDFSGSDAGGERLLGLLQCPEDSLEGCVLVGRSPSFTIWQGIELTGWMPQRLGPETPTALGVRPTGGSTVDVTWVIRSTSGEELVRGGQEGVAVNGQLPAIGPQEALVPGGAYTMDLTATGTIEPYGQLRGTKTRHIVWDPSHSATFSTGFSDSTHGDLTPGDVVYPVADGYRDRIRFELSVPEDDLHDREVWVYAPDGELVHHDYSQVSSQMEWAALDEVGQPLPEGAYNVVVRSRDRALNSHRSEAEVNVSHQQLVQRTWRRTFRPDQTIERRERRCGWFKQPARRRWPDSLGYRTTDMRAWDGCRGTTQLSWAATVNGARVAKSVTGTYGAVRLMVHGGRARWQRHARLGYAVLTPLNSWARVDRWFSGRVGWHVGAWEAGRVDVVDGHPYVRWALATEGGDDYDVRRVTIEVQRYVLQ